MLRVLLLLFLTTLVHAHEFTTTDVRLRIEGDAFNVSITCDLDALALGVSDSADNAVLLAQLKGMDETRFEEVHKGLEEFFLRRARVRFDDQPADFSVRFPQYGNGAEEAEVPTMFGILAVLEGVVPPDAQNVSFSASRSFPALRLQWEDARGPVGDPILQPGGARSKPVPLDNMSLRLSTGELMQRYGWLGFIHILPAGLDHILFVLGLFLICVRWKPLLWQVSAFTLAHTVTLGLSSYGLIVLPSGPVEVLIAASIVYVAVENIATEKVKAHRIVVVYMFGLLHGLGFAGVLGDLGLPREGFFTALLAFNIGVELGQLAVIFIALALVGWARKKDWYRTRIVIPGSVLIGLVGCWWVIERLL